MKQGTSSTNGRTPNRRLVVVQMHGEPGSGKSTIAKALGRAVAAVVLDKDVIKSALLRQGLENAAAGFASYDVLFDLAADLLAKGHSVVIDSPVYWPLVERRSLALACDADAAYTLIECVCPDRDELVRRLATRDALASQPRTPYDFSRTPGTIEPSAPRLTLDTTRPAADLVRAAAAYVHTAAQSAASPTYDEPLAATARAAVGSARPKTSAP